MLVIILQGLWWTLWMLWLTNIVCILIKIMKLPITLILLSSKHKMFKIIFLHFTKFWYFSMIRSASLSSQPRQVVTRWPVCLVVVVCPLSSHVKPCHSQTQSSTITTKSPLYWSHLFHPLQKTRPSLLSFYIVIVKCMVFWVLVSGVWMVVAGIGRWTLSI